MNLSKRRNKLFPACCSKDNPFQKCLPATQINNPAFVVTKEKSH
jgi:hypothetical protein